MGKINKTRYAILGILLDGSSSGYEIKSLMGRSTVYFWRESDSTIYPMLKVLLKEGKVRSKIESVGKKKREVFSITKKGKDEFEEWFNAKTGDEIPRNEFLLKLFFAKNSGDMARLFEERLSKVKLILKEYLEIEERLNGFDEDPLVNVRLTGLRYGMGQLKSEIRWINKMINSGGMFE